MTAHAKFSSTKLRVLQQQQVDWLQGQSGRPRLLYEVWEAAALLAHQLRPSPVVGI